MRLRDKFPDIPPNAWAYHRRDETVVGTLASPTGLKSLDNQPNVKEWTFTNRWYAVGKSERTGSFASVNVKKELRRKAELADFLKRLQSVR